MEDMDRDTVPAGYAMEHRGNLTLVYRSDMPRLGETIGTHGPLGRPSPLSGRTSLRIIEPDMVVRPVMHGGLFRHVTRWRFLSPARTMRELAVSDYLASHGIPTPEILGARMMKTGWFYRIEVISRLVPEAADLLTYLEGTRDDSRELMRKAGVLVGRMHDLGVYHADLHVKNLLLDSIGDLWILDLDKACRFNRLPGYMKRLNVKRFIGSVKKWQAKGRISLPGAWELSFRAGYEETVQ
ncbi:MAG TPA: lipopolysaccharide kinase InaA family protein [Deltaproteobacteria bacterium]|nr:lipopolysaccharide kinase InaA family protein [Deltaproteobacteria bacterium]